MSDFNFHNEEHTLFQQLPNKTMRENLDLIVDLDISTVIDFVYEDATANGLNYEFADDGKSKAAEMGDNDEIKSKSVQDEMGHMIRERHMLTCGKDAFINIFANGFAFASAVPNPEPTEVEACPRIPTILDVRKINVLFFRDVSSMCHFLLFDPNQKKDESDLSIMSKQYGRPITDFIVIGDRTRFPTSDLQFRSLASSLIDEDKVYKNKVALTILADRRRANPQGVVEKDKDPISDKNEVEFTVPAIEEGAIKTSEDHKYHMHNTSVYGTAQAQQQLQIAANLEVQCGSTKANGGSIDKDAPGSEHARNPDRYDAPKSSPASSTAFIPLQAGLRYNPIPPAFSPEDLLPTRQTKREGVCLIMRLPMSLVSHGDASGKPKLNSDSGSSADHMRLFKQSQQGRRREFGNNFTRINTMMYSYDLIRCGYVEPGELESEQFKEPSKNASKEDVKEYKDHQTKKTKYEKLKKMADCVITVNANPHASDVTEAYKNGLLPYASYAENVSKTHDIPLKRMSKKGKITSRELAGIMDDNESGKPPKKKQKK